MKRILLLGPALILLLFGGYFFRSIQSPSPLDSGTRESALLHQGKLLRAERPAGPATPAALESTEADAGSAAWTASAPSPSPTLTSSAVAPNPPATLQKNHPLTAARQSALREAELPSPPTGESWPFYIALYNPTIDEDRMPLTTLPELTPLEKIAVDHAANLFAEELSKPMEGETETTHASQQVDPKQEEEAARKRWLRAKMWADNHLRLTLGYERYNSLGRAERLKGTSVLPLPEASAGTQP